LGHPFRLAAFAAVMVISCVASGASAQARQPWTGYELAIDGPRAVRSGKNARYHGVAYRVRGLAELRPFSGQVRARFARSEGDETGRWSTVASGADGRFVVDVAVPPLDRDHESPTIEVEVGPAGTARRFTVEVEVRSAVRMMLRSDRQLYEPDEPVHVWMLLTDVASGRPLAGQRVELAISGPPLADTTRTIETGPSGVAHVELAIPAGAPSGYMSVTATVRGQLEQRTQFRIGTRTWERLLAEAEVEEDQVPPNGNATVLVHVTTPSGAPVRDAALIVEVSGTEYSGLTDGEGRARITVSAPAWYTRDAGRVGVRVGVVHSAHGSTMAHTTFRLAVPLTLEVEAHAPHGGLVPEVDDVLWVRLRDGSGEPPEAGTEVTVEGPAIRTGRASATTDQHGFVEVPVRMPLGAASASGELPETPLLVHISGPLERTAPITVPVLRDAQVAVTLDRVVAEPGGTVVARLARRPAAARARVTVSLVDDRGEPMIVEHLRPGQSTLRIDLPNDRLGLFTVVARTIREDESLEGPGTIAPLIVRPAGPDFIGLEPERRRWVVGETARVRLTTSQAGGQKFAALLVRDLSAHGGELPFTRSFLEGAFDRAILDPTTPASDRLLRAALAAHAGADDPSPTAPPLVDALGLPTEETLDDTSYEGPLRDPWPIGRELSRRGVARAMFLVEDRLTDALDADALDEVTTGRGTARRFRDDVLGPHDDVPPTLGGGHVTPAILEAADPSFSYHNVARRVARARLVSLMVTLAHYLDPGDDASPAERMAAREPAERWLPRMVERGLVDSTALDDPWGGQFQLRATRTPSVVLSARATSLELVSPGPDGRPGTRDDVRDPFARAVTAGTPYAVASGEDVLMRRLSILSPLAATLEAIRESYRRISAEMTEEAIGDAVSAEVSEGTIGLGSLGLIGHGGGGGGSGYGSGHGGMGRRSSRVPMIRSGSASMSGLAGIVRERFPPTLLFLPTLEVDPSGTTEIEIPLADTVTTYLVEAIVWREDGWVWSESTRIEVDRDIVVDAPIPETAHEGDRVRLPLRVSNRGTTPREIVVRLLGDASLGIPDSEPHPLTLAPGDAASVPIEVELSRVGEGQLTVVASAPDGEAIDAVRRPIRVLALARRVTIEREEVADGEAEITFSVPRGADDRSGSVWVGVGPVVFGAEGPSDPWTYWSPPSPGIVDPVRALHNANSPAQEAFFLGSSWVDGATGDSEVMQQAVRLTPRIDNVIRNLERGESTPGIQLRFEAWSLLGLAPIALSPDARGIVEPGQLVSRLRDDVADHAVALSDDPEGWVLAAAALGFTAPNGEGGPRVAELVRRLRRNAVEVGEDRWLATERRAVRSTLLWAIAELSLGHRDAALRLLSTVGRWLALGHTLDNDERGLASATISRLLGGRLPTTAVVFIDGQRREVSLEHGAASIEAPELARPGRHRIVARVRRGAVVDVSTSVSYGISWRHSPPERGPLELEIDGSAGGVDEVAELELVIRNRTPRTLPRPTVEVELPTGAELTARDRGAIAGRVRNVSSGGGVLHLVLGPMPPGSESRIPLPLRWSVDGRLRGLGVAAWADDRPEGVTILRPRAMDLRPAGDAGGER